jgi:hypothetical protein
MFKYTMTNMGKVLYSPKGVFEDPQYSRNSTAALLLCSYLAVLLTALVSFTITNHEGVKNFQVEMGVKQAMKMMPGSSETDEAAVREQIRKQMYSRASQIGGQISVVITTFLGLLGSILFFWAYMAVVLRFAGGEEEPVMIQTRKGPKEKKHRNSYILSYYRYLPLLVGALISSLILMTGNKESLYNISSLEDLTRKLSVNLTLYALLFEGSLPTQLETVMNIITSPFWWWSGWITVEGMKKVWRIPTAKAVYVFIGWAVLASLSQIGGYALTSFFTA